MGRLLGNPEKRDFFENQIHDFEYGNSFFILISSLASLFGTYRFFGDSDVGDIEMLMI